MKLDSDLVGQDLTLERPSRSFAMFSFPNTTVKNECTNEKNSQNDWSVFLVLDNYLINISI